MATRIRRARVTEVDGRRLSSAGHAMVVAVLALAIGLLLDAPGLHKSAFNEPAGTQRSVALAITKPLESTSHALFLDRPRSWLKDALGRSGDDTIDTRVVVLPPPPTKTSRPALETGAAVPGEPGKGKAFSARRTRCASGWRATRS